MAKKKTKKKAVKKKAGCTCMKQVDKKLEKDNTRLCYEVMVDFSGPKVSKSNTIIATEKIDTKSRKRKIMLFASHCPFCGKKYPGS